MNNLGSSPNRPLISNQIPIGMVCLYSSLYLRLEAYYWHIPYVVNSIQKASYLKGTLGHPRGINTHMPFIGMLYRAHLGCSPALALGMVESLTP